MIKLYFKTVKHEPGMGQQTVELAQRSANCVPRAGELVRLELNGVERVVDRIEYLWGDAPEGHYFEQVGVWLK